MVASFDYEKMGGGSQKGDLNGQQKGPSSRRSRLILWAVVSTLLVLGLALGLGLGFTLGRGRSGIGAPASSSNPSSAGHPAPSAVWQPAVGSSWQIVLDQTLDIDDNAPSIKPDVQIFDIDMFLHQNTTVLANLHKLGKKVICYFSAGSFEPNRPDSNKFQESDLGKPVKGWPGERWLNISSPSIQDIMASRVDIAGQMGCDGIDPDNVDGYQNDNGLSLTSDDSIDFLTFLAGKASEHNMSVGLKNANDIIPDVLSLVQFAVNEQCAESNNCGTTHPFIKAGKPVFHIEYPSGAPTNVTKADSTAACSAIGESQFSTVLKTVALGGWVQYCDGAVANTSVYS